MDRNATTLLVYLALIRSLSARRAWIEISGCDVSLNYKEVALRKESVDRNFSSVSDSLPALVALRKESVDRNVDPDVDALIDDVALRKESVDRNWFSVALKAPEKPSLSARRAWIEIKWIKAQYPGCRVALRKESVDRNQRDEMDSYLESVVALRKESVDRNIILYPSILFSFRRSPQGERG